MIIGLHVCTRYSCQILMKLKFSEQIFDKHANIKFHENPSSGSRVVLMRTDRLTGREKERRTERQAGLHDEDNNLLRFLLGSSPASELYTPTFRNTLSFPSS